MRGLQGDQVTLSAENSSMQIKTMARALQDGSFGDMIRLVNTRSGRTVQGQVSAVGSRGRHILTQECTAQFFLKF